MTVLHSGATKAFAEGWEKIFGGKTGQAKAGSKKKPAGKKAARSAPARKAPAKAVKKKK